jgi:hypothetical protein
MKAGLIDELGELLEICRQCRASAANTWKVGVVARLVLIKQNRLKLYNYVYVPTLTCLLALCIISSVSTEYGL